MVVKKKPSVYIYKINESKTALITHPVQPKKAETAITLRLIQFSSCNLSTPHHMNRKSNNITLIGYNL